MLKRSKEPLSKKCISSVGFDDYDGYECDHCKDIWTAEETSKFTTNLNKTWICKKCFCSKCERKVKLGSPGYYGDRLPEEKFKEIKGYFFCEKCYSEM